MHVFSAKTPTPLSKHEFKKKKSYKIKKLVSFSLLKQYLRQQSACLPVFKNALVWMGENEAKTIQKR